MRALHDFRNRIARRSWVVRYLEYTFAAAVVLVVVGGSLNDFLEFVLSRVRSPYGIAFVGLTAISALVFVYVTRPELRPLRGAGLPAEADLTLQDAPLVSVTRVSTPWQVDEIGRIAADAFAGNAMPLDQIRALHWHCRDTVFVMSHGEHGIIGYLAMMFPTAATVELMYSGKIDTLELKPEHFITGSTAWEQPHLYIDSIAICKPRVTHRFITLSRVVLEEIQGSLERYRSDLPPLTVYALGGSDEGRNLIRRFLGLTKIADKVGRADEMELYEGELSIEIMRERRKHLDRISEAVNERSGSFAWT